MTFDLEKYESDKIKALIAIYAEIKNTAEKNGHGDYARCHISTSDVVRLAANNEAQATRILADLAHEKYLKSLSRNSYALTPAGINQAEYHLYESSPLAKRRKLKAGAKGLLGKMFASTASQAASLTGAFVAGIISRDLFPAMIEAIREAFGL